MTAPIAWPDRPDPLSTARELAERFYGNARRAAAHLGIAVRVRPLDARLIYLPASELTGGVSLMLVSPSVASGDREQLIAQAVGHVVLGHEPRPLVERLEGSGCPACSQDRTFARVFAEAS